MLSQQQLYRANHRRLKGPDCQNKKIGRREAAPPRPRAVLHRITFQHFHFHDMDLALIGIHMGLEFHVMSFVTF